MTDRPVLEIENTEEMIEAGVVFVKDFYPAEWGAKSGIGNAESKLLVTGLLAKLFQSQPEKR